MTLLPTPEPPMIVSASPRMISRLRPLYTTFSPNAFHTFLNTINGVLGSSGRDLSSGTVIQGVSCNACRWEICRGGRGIYPAGTYRSVTENDDARDRERDEQQDSAD